MVENLGDQTVTSQGRGMLRPEVGVLLTFGGNILRDDQSFAAAAKTIENLGDQTVTSQGRGC